MSEGNHPYDVVVVGNGSLGLSLGLELARRKVRVAVLGQPHRPGAASTAAGAMLGAFGEVTADLMNSESGRSKHELAYQASKLWPEWVSELPRDSTDADLFTAKGTFVMLNAVGMPELDTRNYKAIRDSLVKYGENFEDVDPEDIDWLDAEPTARPLQAMFLPDEHAVNATELVMRLEKAFLAAGGMLIAERATRVEHAHGRVHGIALESGTILRTHKTVLAAGAFSQTVLDSVPEQAVQIPRLVSGYGVSAVVDTVDGTCPQSVIRTPNRAFACGLHVVPRPEGQVYVGATNIISMEPRETALISDVLFLLNCGNRQVRRGLADSGLRKIQVGNRPVPLDGMPLIGETGLSGLWMMTGTYRDGLTLSPLLAREMAALLLEEEATVDLEQFRPVRPPVQLASREEVVEATVMHMLATGYESNWDVPLYWPATIEHYLREAYTQRAQDLDPTFTPPPELLAAVRTNPVLEKGLRDYYAASRSGAAGVSSSAAVHAADREETVEDLLRDAVRTLTNGGVPYPRQDANELLAHVLGSHEPQRRVSGEEAREVRALVARRADRIPIGHILGYARLGGIVVTVTEDVFVPLFPTERLLAWGLSTIAEIGKPLVVDLCTGSAAVALAVAHARPDAQVHAVDVDEKALDCAHRNAAMRVAAGDTPVAVHAGDVADQELLSDLRGEVDLVLANPPYVPEGTELAPEFAKHNPARAIFSGADGLDVIRQVIATAGRLLRPGGALAIEHDDPQIGVVPALLAESGLFGDAVGHRDQENRPRYTTAFRK
ncbi:FAD-dependent oxidoreductase [Lentzea sp. BCCO 10_0061]|uniref:peptide chain release factor N(5)-glutamine methyltransferase n=1 Tax=Lentzea sokolovensis TaxID=3095429 RepID=A0ABU4VAT2_9PSEU|nr:FAD-dependent oxidoreductase [Lentzea sp. BCCO 10_0061]MDX8148913.1 FAD-dependent oxidoreductase [Lentzea sp. BCCO 10_0061]